MLLAYQVFRLLLGIGIQCGLAAAFCAVGVIRWENLLPSAAAGFLVGLAFEVYAMQYKSRRIGPRIGTDKHG